MGGIMKKYLIPLLVVIGIVICVFSILKISTKPDTTIITTLPIQDITEKSHTDNYYLKILLPLFAECDKNTFVPTLNANFSQKFVLVVTAIVTMLIGIYPEKIIELCRFIAYNI